jgi:eukaryotic-like serine/threonine-protein kinase
VVARRLKLAAKEKPMDNVLDYVGSISFFSGFSQQQVKAVLAASTVNRVPRDRVVVAEGEVDDCLYIILSGQVAVIKQRCRIDTIGRGECFGEMAYLSGQPRTATIRTLTDCILMKIRAGLMEKASQAVQLRFMHSFSTTLVERISQNHNHILNLVAQRRSRPRTTK